ncbi:MAG: DUF4384 domain-containing protein [Nitrospirae bacterium]|nr:DUF4384 domain-containing protein [Nitrospirota bacterium]
MNKRRFFFLTLLMLLVPSLSWAQAQTDTAPPKDGRIEVIGEGEHPQGEDSLPAQCKSTARNNAMRNALEQAVGVEVRGSSVIYNSDLISDLVRTATKGLIVDYKVLEEGPKLKDGQVTYYCKLKANVKPISAEKRGSFGILKMKVYRPDKKSAMAAPVFQDNDEIQVSVSVNEDSYINIFSVGQDGAVSKLFPNQHVRVEVLPARKEFIFPDDTYRMLGLKLRVTTPKKLSRAVESVLIIASKEKVDLLSGNVHEPMITDLMKELSEIDPSLWTDKTVGYEVRK